MRVLFVCNQGRHRSKTAAEVFASEFETRYRGIYENAVTAEDMTWADLIIVMENHQRSALGDFFPAEYLRKRILCLDIPDLYSYGQPRLVNLLKEGMSVLEPFA